MAKKITPAQTAKPAARKGGKADEDSDEAPSSSLNLVDN